MKDLSFFLFKNYLGSKMRKGFKHFCNGDGSTSTLNQQTMMGPGQAPSASVYNYTPFLDGQRQPTLEEMILQLEMEEAASRRAKLDEEYGEIRHRMSCVNSSDILRSARSALNQYPRFSLDGKDAMYRSSFRNLSPARNSLGRGFYADGSTSERQKLRGMPATVAGERVVWCSPGVVAKLMGLEAMPIPVQRFRTGRRRDHLGLLDASGIKGQNQNLRRRAGRLDNEIEKTRSAFDPDGCGGGLIRRGRVSGSCSSSRQGYCVMKPLGPPPAVDVELRNEQLEWQMLRFRQNDASQF